MIKLRSISFVETRRTRKRKSLYQTQSPGKAGCLSKLLIFVEDEIYDVLFYLPENYFLRVIFVFLNADIIYFYINTALESH